MGEPGGRPPLQGRDHGRGDSTEPAVGDGPRNQERASQPGQLATASTMLRHEPAYQRPQPEAAPVAYGAGHEDEEPF